MEVRNNEEIVINVEEIDERLGKLGNEDMEGKDVNNDWKKRLRWKRIFKDKEREGGRDRKKGEYIKNLN